MFLRICQPNSSLLISVNKEIGYSWALEFVSLKGDLERG